MNNFTWKMLFLLLMFAYGAIRYPYSKKYRKIERISARKKLREYFLLFICSIGIAFVPYLYMFSELLDPYNINLPQWARWLGVILCLLSLVFFWWVHKFLNTNWSPILEIRKDHTLITDGPYKYARHPMYTQVWLWFICQFIILSNWVVGITGLICWAITYFIRVNDEEQMMIEQFGDKYINYMKSTGRLFPKIF